MIRCTSLCCFDSAKRAHQEHPSDIGLQNRQHRCKKAMVEIASRRRSKRYGTVHQLRNENDVRNYSGTTYVFDFARCPPRQSAMLRGSSNRDIVEVVLQYRRCSYVRLRSSLSSSPLRSLPLVVGFIGTGILSCFIRPLVGLKSIIVNVNAACRYGAYGARRRAVP